MEKKIRRKGKDWVQEGQLRDDGGLVGGGGGCSRGNEKSTSYFHFQNQNASTSVSSSTELNQNIFL